MSDAHAVRKLYAKAHDSPTTPLALPTSWLAWAVHPEPPPLRPGSRVLVAGCGTGNELLGFAADPTLELVGVDFAEAGLAVARERLEAAGCADRVTLVHGDLTRRGLAAELGHFDVVLASAVADYVPDAPACMDTLSRCLKPGGACVMTTNRPSHPRSAVHRALDALGLDPADPEQARTALAVVDAARPEAPPLASLAEGLVAMDLLVSFAHHWPLEKWVGVGRSVGLHLAGTLGGPALLPAIPDARLADAMALGLDGLALLHDRTTLDGGRTALFTKAPVQMPPFADPEALARWAPVAAEAFAGLAPLEGDPHTRRPITLPLQGHGSWSATIPAWVVEVLRRADGESPLGELLDGLPDAPQVLGASLFRVWALTLVR